MTVPPRESTRRRTITATVAVAATAAVVAVLAAFAWQRLSQPPPRAIVPLERLLMDQPAVGLPSDPLTWTRFRTWRHQGEPTANLTRRWTNNGRAPELTLTVQRFPSPGQASNADDPIRPIASSFETEPETFEPPQNLDADQAEIACVGSSPGGCPIWIYWAQYGQYTVALNYTDIDSGTPYDTFASHVQRADRDAARGLVS